MPVGIHHLMHTAVCYRPLEADSNSNTVSCVSVFFPESNTLCIPGETELCCRGSTQTGRHYYSIHGTLFFCCTNFR